MTWIDVSHWQGVIDWSRVRAAGVTDAYIKATQAGWTDSRFRQNWQGAKAAGVRRGAYLFFDARVSGVWQANVLLGVLGTDRGEHPPAVDLEDSFGQTREIVTNETHACLHTLWAKDGRLPAVYTGAGQWNRLTTQPAWASTYPLWIADPGPHPPTLPVGWTEWWLWQYSWVGRVDGIGGDVDLNRENVPAPSIAALAADIRALAEQTLGVIS